MQKPEFCSSRSECISEKEKEVTFFAATSYNVSKHWLYSYWNKLHVLLILVLLWSWKPFDLSIIVSNISNYFFLYAEHVYCVPANFSFLIYLSIFFNFSQNAKCSARLDFFTLFCSGRYSATHFVSVGLGAAYCLFKWNLKLNI